MEPEQAEQPQQGPRVMSATELTIMAMEQFGKDEPNHCLIVFTTPRGNMAYLSTHPILTINIGLLRLMEQQLINIALGHLHRE